MKQLIAISKAELARQLGVSRAYITMIANGKRIPSEEVVNKLNGLSFGKSGVVNKNEANLVTLNHPVQRSSRWRLSIVSLGIVHKNIHKVHSVRACQIHCSLF